MATINYEIKDANLPQIVCNIVENNVTSELIIDLTNNYSAVPLDILKNYSVALLNKFNYFLTEMKENNDATTKWIMYSVCLGNIAILKNQLDEYIQSQEPII